MDTSQFKRRRIVTRITAIVGGSETTWLDRVIIELSKNRDLAARIVRSYITNTPTTTSPAIHTGDIEQLYTSLTTTETPIISSTLRSSSSSSSYTSTIIPIIPPFSISLIFQFLDASELLSAASVVCHEWLRVLEKPTTWTHFVYDDEMSRFPDISKSTIVSTDNIRFIDVSCTNVKRANLTFANGRLSTLIDSSVMNLRKLTLRRVDAQVLRQTIFGDNPAGGGYSCKDTNRLEHLTVYNVTGLSCIRSSALGSLRVIDLWNVRLQHAFIVCEGTPLETLELASVHAPVIDISACMKTLQIVRLLNITTNLIMLSSSSTTVPTSLQMPSILQLKIYAGFERIWIAPLIFAATQSLGLLRLDIRVPITHDITTLPLRMPSSLEHVNFYGAWNSDTFADDSHMTQTQLADAMKLTNRILDMGSGSGSIMRLSLRVYDFDHMDTVCKRFDVEFKQLCHIQLDVRNLSAKFEDFVVLPKEDDTMLTLTQRNPPTVDAVRILTVEDASDGSHVAMFINPLNREPIHTPVDKVKYKINIFWSESVVRAPMQKLVVDYGGEMRLWLKSCPSMHDWTHNTQSWCCAYSRSDTIPCWCSQLDTEKLTLFCQRK